MSQFPFITGLDSVPGHSLLLRHIQCLLMRTTFYTETIANLIFPFHFCKGHSWSEKMGTFFFFLTGSARWTQLYLGSAPFQDLGSAGSQCPAYRALLWVSQREGRGSQFERHHSRPSNLISDYFLKAFVNIVLLSWIIFLTLMVTYQSLFIFMFVENIKLYYLIV